MLYTILISVLTTIMTALIIWAATLVWRRQSETIDRQKVYKWLRLNTRDEPGESHVDTTTKVGPFVKTTK